MVYDTFGEIEDILLSKNYRQNLMYPTDWETCLRDYYNLFEEIVNGIP